MFSLPAFNAMLPVISKNLDSVRGAAAFFVLLAHTNQWFLAPILGPDHYAGIIMGYGAHLAVLIFFALSGYLITGSLVSNYLRNGRIDSLSYASARIARIVPPALAACIFSLSVAYLILGAGLHGSDTFRTATDLYVARERIVLVPKDVLASFLLSNGIIPGSNPIVTNGPLWSLSIEFWAYFIALLAACFLVMARKRDHTQRILMWLTAISLLTLLGFFAARPFEIMQYLFYWFVGCLLFIRGYHPPFANRLLILTLIAAISATSYLVYNRTSIDFINSSGFTGLLTIPIKAAVIIVMSALVPYIGYLPFSHLLGKLASSSYTLYVFHFPVLCLYFSLFHKMFLKWDILERFLFLSLVVFSIIISCHLLARILENKKKCEALLNKFAPIIVRKKAVSDTPH